MILQRDKSIVNWKIKLMLLLQFMKEKSIKILNVKQIRCYLCTSSDGGCTDLEHGESTIDCPAIKGCRIAKTLDNGHGDPTWVGQIYVLQKNTRGMKTPHGWVRSRSDQNFAEKHFGQWIWDWDSNFGFSDHSSQAHVFR